MFQRVFGAFTNSLIMVVYFYYNLSPNTMKFTIIDNFRFLVPKMLSLKSLCFLRVSSLKLPFEDLPGDLPVELRKMELFNGNFSIDELSKDKRTVLSIQYLGNDDWSIQVCSQFKRCKSCRVGKCRKKPQLSQIVLNEKKTSASVVGNLKGLMAFGFGHANDFVERVLLSGVMDQMAVYTSVDVKEDPETNSGILRINYEEEAG